MTQPATPRVGPGLPAPRRPDATTLATPETDLPTALTASPAALARAEVVVIGDGPHPGPDAVTVAREIAHRLDGEPGRVVLLAHAPPTRSGGDPGARPEEGPGPHVRPHPVPAHWVGPLVRSWAEQGLDWGQMQDELAAVRRQVALNFGAPSLRGSGVAVAVGTVRLLDRGRIAFDGAFDDRAEHHILTPQRIVLATGAASVPPDVAGVAETQLHLAESVLDLPARPSSVVVYGGGAHGCEMAQGLARAGATVTLIESGPRLLADLPDGVAQLVVDALHADGVRMMTGARLVSVAPTLDGGAWVGTDNGDVAAEAFVLATGRRARCAGLDLAAAGAGTGPAGQVLVDDRLRAGSGTVLACGEMTGMLGYGGAPGPMARVLAANATSRRGTARFEPPAQARLTRTDPEVVLVGDPAVLSSLPAGAVSGSSTGPGEGTSVQVVLAAGGSRGVLGRSGHTGRTLAAAVLVGPGAGEAAGQLVLAASAHLPAASLIDIDAPDGTWAAAIQSCVARTLADG